MRKLTTILVILLAIHTPQLFAQTSEAEKEVVDSAYVLTRQIGEVHLIGATWIISITDTDGNEKRFVPDVLPENLKFEGQEIIFSGVFQDPPPNVRTMGHPVQIEAIWKLDRAKPKDE